MPVSARMAAANDMYVSFFEALWASGHRKYQQGGTSPLM